MLALVGGCGDDGASGGADAPTPVAAPAEAPEAEAAQSRGVKLVRVGRFNEPTYVTAPPGDRTRYFVVEQAGRIRVVRNGRARTPSSTSPADVQSGGERGLLSMAFAPDYRSSRRFYVYFTDDTGDIRIQEFRARTNDVADKGSRRDVLRQAHRQFSNHNGGQLAFGRDGFLYAGLGDGGGGDDPLRSGQSLRTLLGKLIRIDPRASGGRPYSIPAGNPFRDRDGARPEIWAYGLRNPFRFSFDRRTGRPDHRRRGPERGRGDRFRQARHGRRGELRMAPVRGQPAQPVGLAERRPARAHHVARQRQLLDHRRLRRARPRRARAVRPLRLRRLLQPAHPVGAALEPRARAGTAPPGCGCRTCPRSARTRAGACMRFRCPARCTASPPADG